MIRILKAYPFRIIIFLVFLAVAVAYLVFLQNTKKSLLYSNYNKEVISLQKRLENNINTKEKSTLALALTLAVSDQKLVNHILKNHIPHIYYKTLILEYKKNTLYKNIWIQVLDKNGKSLYRSWSKKTGDNVSSIRKEVASMLKSKKITTTISVGIYDLTIKAMVPIVFNKKFVGIVEVISHFNSIAKEFLKMDVDSVIVANKEYKKQLNYPFSKKVIGDYYVANLDAKNEKMDYLAKHGIENYINNSFKIENGYLIVSYLLKRNENPVGVYIMFKRLDKIASNYIDNFMLRLILLGIVAFIVVLGIINTIIYFILKRQKRYYKDIIDTSSNIITINNKEEILDANKTFFKYFIEYKNIDEFKKEHNCICNFFVKEEGYITKDMGDYDWMDYILEYPTKINKVKINSSGEVFYFLISASLLSSQKKQYSVILSDITQEEKYKKKIEQISITDPLTGIFNRRYYDQKIKEEISSAKRYDFPLSLVMLDIDFFKKINDDYGHDTGDEVLKEYTNLISSLLRNGDKVCRIGGEEFAVILPHITVNEAAKVAEKLRTSIEKHKKILPITMSFGAVQYIKGESTDSIFKRADNALYEAKNSGRNKVVVRFV